MSDVFTWFIEMIVCSGVLYANYCLLLRNNRFHSYNRYYLLASVVLSILVPSVHIPVDFGTSDGKPPAMWQALTAISSAARTKPNQVVYENISLLFNLKNAFILFYLLMASAIFARFVAAIFFIGKLLRRYKSEQTGKIYFVNTEEPTTPFSFFKWLFWNDKIKLQSNTGQQIFRHELFHIQQKHSWDLTFLELTTAAFWINPFFHLIKREVKTIHEFLADEFATTENDRWSYAELLIMQALGSSPNRLVNPFFHNQIKRRIAMITSSKIPKYQFFRKLMILPIILLVLALFAFKMNNYSDKNSPEPIHANAISDASGEFKVLTFDPYVKGLDTIKPKEKEKEKKKITGDQTQTKKKENDAENVELQKLQDEKSREAQERQKLFEKVMAESQKEMGKNQEQLKKMMEMSQREATENQEKLKLVLEQRERETAMYQEQLKKVMENGQKEGNEKFKQLMEERQVEMAKFQEQFKEMRMARQKEVEKSQQELKKLLEERRLQTEDFKREMMLIQKEKEKARKQVI